MVAKSRPLAQRAAKLIKIKYEDLPAIITIEVTIQAIIKTIPEWLWLYNYMHKL